MFIMFVGLMLFFLTTKPTQGLGQNPEYLKSIEEIKDPVLKKCFRVNGALIRKMELQITIYHRLLLVLTFAGATVLALHLMNLRPEIKEIRKNHN